ncbi:MAG: GNAT family N-acetyltransferase [Lactobacillales bacterium]|nr:GNAT family N-acetyltransferase [Lactobacillales bacterium]
MIRRAKKEEWIEIQRLNQKLFDHEIERFDKSLDPDWPQNNAACFQDVVSADDFLVLVCDIQGKIVGYMTAELRPAAYYRKPRTLVEINNIFIEADCRHQNIGGKFMAAALEWAKEKEADLLTVTASAGNESAISFYKKNGFVPYNVTLEKMVK